METKTNGKLLADATQNLKKGIKSINKEIIAQQSIIEVIDIKSKENTLKMTKSANKFEEAVINLKKDRRNLIIFVLLFIITILFFIIF